MNYSAEFDEATTDWLRDYARKTDTAFENVLETAQNIARHLPDGPEKSARLIWCMICAQAFAGAAARAVIESVFRSAVDKATIRARAKQQTTHSKRCSPPQRGIDDEQHLAELRAELAENKRVLEMIRAGTLRVSVKKPPSEPPCDAS